MIHGSDADIGYWDCPKLTGNSCRKEKELRFEAVLNCTEYFYYDLLWVYPFSDLSSWRAFICGSIKKKHEQSVCDKLFEIQYKIKQSWILLFPYLKTQFNHDCVLPFKHS